mgnify:CR=1 FL=1
MNKTVERDTQPVGRDTIVAPATAAGRGGVGVVRVSGPQVPQIAQKLLGRLPKPRRALLAQFADADGTPLDLGLALYFPAPASFTGEHVLELQGHGGAVVLQLLVERVVQLGARRALPGEFSQRAYLNDKLDLAQAEAVADLIDAGSRAAARAAMRSLQGDFSRRVNALLDALVALRMYIEAAIDFPEEEIDFLSSQEVRERLDDVRQRLTAAQREARQGVLLQQGLHVVIAGRPNAGKSSLLNRLAGQDVAIVTPIAGTTRDLLRERIDIDGLPLHVVDTAGLRASTDDPIEQEGMRRAREELRRADRVLFVVDTAADPGAKAYAQERASLPEGVPVTLVYNKCDVAQPTAPRGRKADAPERVLVSATTGEGMDALREHLKAAMGYAGEGGGTVTARARHVQALQDAAAAFERAEALLQRKQGELVAEELRQAQQHLAAITGEFSSDDLLGKIFGSFCIGK